MLEIFVYFGDQNNAEKMQFIIFIFKLVDWNGEPIAGKVVEKGIMTVSFLLSKMTQKR